MIDKNRIFLFAICFFYIIVDRKNESIHKPLDQSKQTRFQNTLNLGMCLSSTDDQFNVMAAVRTFILWIQTKNRFTHKLQKRRNINRTATITKIAKKNSWLSPQTQNFNTFLLYISRQANGEYPWKKISYMIVENTEYARQSVKRSSILMFQCTEWIYRSVWWWCLSLCVRVCNWWIQYSGAGVCAHLYIFADSVCTNWNGWKEFQYIGQTTMARQPTVDYISIIISFWLQFLSIGWAPMHETRCTEEKWQSQAKPK